MVETRLSLSKDLIIKQQIKSPTHPVAVRFDTAVVLLSKKGNQPVGGPQTTAADFQQARFGRQAFAQELCELTSATFIEGLGRHAKKSVVERHLLAKALDVCLFLIRCCLHCPVCLPATRSV